jgi:hypothetical protein
VLTSGNILDFPSPGGANSSYTTTISSPQVSCSQQIRGIQDANVIQNFDSANYHFKVSWIGESIESEPNLLEVTSREKLQWFKFPGQKDSGDNDAWKRTGNETVLQCRPALAKLVLNISYSEGFRRITYVTKNVQTFKPVFKVDFTYRNEGNQTRVSNPEVDLQIAEIKEHVRTWNILALLDAAMQAFEFTCADILPFRPVEDGQIQENYNYCSEKDELQAVAFWRIDILTIIVELPFTDMFLSDQQRKYDTDPGYYKFIKGNEMNITETIINEYLAMTAISALSLNVGETPVPVTSTTYQATYTFSNPFNLILPYSLSLFFCAIFVGIGIWSWAHNGASAADGGFLQVMTATTGRTRMEDLVIAQHIDKDNLPEELLDLEVRYGELLDAHGVGTGVAGFGTVEETKLLRKGWRPS